mgnify:CR=1 FL=1
MKKLIYLIGLTLLLVACGGNEEANSDETKNYKESTGEITNEDLLINLAVRAESTIEEFKSLDGVKVDQKDITAEKLENQTVDGKEYPNVYRVQGKYAWEGKTYDFEWMISFNENDVTAAGNHLNFK